MIVPGPMAGVRPTCATRVTSTARLSATVRQDLRPPVPRHGGRRLLSRAPTRCRQGAVSFWSWGDPGSPTSFEHRPQSGRTQTDRTRLMGICSVKWSQVQQCTSSAGLGALFLTCPLSGTRGNVSSSSWSTGPKRTSDGWRETAPPTTSGSSSVSSTLSIHASKPRRRCASGCWRRPATSRSNGWERATTADSPFADDTSTSRRVAFAKIEARVRGTRLAADNLGL